jgi:phosphatidylinositol alpha-1,6-mannosyltransferase
VTGPASLYLQWKWDVPAIQYTYAKELGRRTRVAKLALAHSSRTIAISTYTRERVLQLGAASDRVRLILPGVDPPARQGAVTCLAEREPIVITVARLVDRYKGFDMILRALPGIRERVPNVRWVVVGEGPLRAELEQQARDLEVAHAVSFVGAVDNDERDRLLDNAAVFAMPSRLDPSHTGGEGFGLVYLEAAARGLPTVAGNVGGATDAVVHDQTGLLVDPTDPIAVGRAISDLLVDRDRAERLGQAARTYAGTLTWERMGRAFECVVAEAIASR